MIDNVTAAHKVSMASRLVTVWSPWWGKYLGEVDFTYGIYPGKRITGLSSMVFIVDNEYIATSSLMDVAVTLEFALQQSARNMDARGDSMSRKYPEVAHDVIGLSQALEINSDIEDKFHQLDPARWKLLVSRAISREHQGNFDANEPPRLPEGSWTSGDMGLPHGLRAEKYLELLIERDHDAESEYLDSLEPEEKEEYTGDNDENYLGNDSEESQEVNSSGDREGNAEDDQDGDVPDTSSDQQEDTELPNLNQDNDTGEGAGDSDDHSSGSNDTHAGNSSGSGGDNSASSNETSRENSGGEPGSTHSDSSMDSSTDENTPSSPVDATESLDGTQMPPSNSSSSASTLGTNLSMSGSDIDTQDTDTHNMDHDTNDVSSNDSSSMDSNTVNNPSSSPVDATESLDGTQMPSSNSSSSTATLGTFSGTQKHDAGTVSEKPIPLDAHSEVSSADNELDQQNTQHNSEETNGVQDQEDYEYPSASPTTSPVENEDNQASSVDNEENKKPGNQKFKSVADTIRSTANDVGMHQMTIPNKPEGIELTGTDQYDRDDILNELAEDIQSFADKMPSGAPSVGKDFVTFAGKKLKKPANGWKKLLPRMLEPVMSRGQMSGQSDMSYAKRNPNQQDDLPIMMGFLSYPPEVTVLIDSSYSMVNQKAKVMSQFVGVMKTFFMRYAQPITVAMGDSHIQYAETSLTPYKRVMREISKTHKGSSVSFGETIELTAKKGVKLKNRFFPKPDILIILTDCAFEWPWHDRGSPPSTCGEIIIISTEPYEKASSVLPRWVKNRKNFIYIG